MPKCPNCQENFSIPDEALLNMGAHLKPVNTVTNCCKVIVTCTPKTIYTVHSYHGEKDVDDWDNEGKKLDSPLKFFE